MEGGNFHTLYWAGATALERPAAAAANLAGTGITLAAASEINWLIIDPADLIEVGVFPTVTTGANTFAFTVTKAQTTAAASDLASPLAILTGPAAAAIAPGRALRGYKDFYSAALLSGFTPPESHPTNRSSFTPAMQTYYGTALSPAYDMWHFDRGDVLVFTVSDVSAAGGLGIFYATFQRTGSQRTNSKRLLTPVAGPITAATEFTVDLDSTT